jgi:hypothetical protein
MKRIIIGLVLMTLAVGSVKAESWEAMLRRWDLENARIAEQQAFEDAEYAAKRAAEDAQMAAQIAEGDAQFARWQAEQAAEKQQETLDEINDKLDRIKRGRE